MSISDLLDMHPEPQLEQMEEDLEEPEDPHAPFYDYVPAGPSRLDPQLGIHTDICHLDGNGNHRTMARSCPHFETEDQEGRRIATGWTVQSSR